MIEETFNSVDRYKVFVLSCTPDKLSESIAFVQNQSITALDIGKELAEFIDRLEDFSYLNIDVFDYVKKLLDKHKAKKNNTGNEVVAIYNLGILLEPTLGLNAAKLLKEFSKSAALIIIWENQSDIPERLHWSTQQNNVFLDFTETHIKKLQYAI